MAPHWPWSQPFLVPVKMKVFACGPSRWVRRSRRGVIVSNLWSVANFAAVLRNGAVATGSGCDPGASV